MADPEQSILSSALTDLPDGMDTPSPQDSRSMRQINAPPAPRADRISHSPVAETAIEQLQAFMRQMEIRFAQQQRDTESRIEALLAARSYDAAISQPTLAEQPTAHPVHRVPAGSPVNPFIDIPKPEAKNSVAPSELPIAPPPGFESVSPVVQASSLLQQQIAPHPSSFEKYSAPAAFKSHTKIKASDLPKFYGNKSADVEVWIEQLSAIFSSNGCTDSEIVALLSMVLKNTALKWFTRLGPKGRSQLHTWTHWQDALRQRFLKANYLAEKKRLWKKRELRADEEMADYFDAKVDLQSYVFNEEM
ncbi:hypothetical protein QFC19_001360 [Naganishia cerealis]|uniref:Uncharacterized protein n=1 Tax=Naganishia cerealis TaxID=610337 RepID=A0ACC2WIF4_9TREE|nr:hypothetical protein QFC19_001360 [Naganishia cerealis]